MGNRTNLLVFVFLMATCFSQISLSETCYDAMGNSLGACFSDAPTSSAGGGRGSINPPLATQPQAGQKVTTQQTKRTISKAVSGSPCSLEGLDFVGISFSQRLGGGKCTTMSGITSDAAAAKAGCAGYFINPDNPQYGGNGGRSSGSKDYFCIQGANFDKRTMCQEGIALHNQKDSRNQLDYVFQPQPGQRDADCLCKPKGSSANSAKLKYNDCAQTFPAVAADECGTGAINSGTGCVCDTQAGYEDFEKGCRKKPVATEPNKPVNPNEVTPALRECADNKAKESLQCGTSATAANKKCDEDDKSNKEVNSAIAMPGQIAAQFISSKQGSGMQTECMKAGAIGQGTKGLMSTLKQSCDEELGICDKECDLNTKVKEYIDTCFALAIKPSEGAASEGESTPDMDYYHNKLNEVRKNIGEGIPICKHDAVKKKDKLNDLLLGLANVINAGMTCACQVAATAVGASSSSCSSLPSAEQCAANQALPGCVALEVLDKCTMGSPAYNAKGCSCSQNPKEQGCSEYARANPGNNGFAGAGIKNPASSGMFGPTDGAGGTGSGGGDKIDLSSKPDDAAPNAKAGGSAGPGFLGGSQGASGGGASAPAGAGEQAAAKEEGEEAKGVGGLWGQAKSAVGSLFGTGSAKTNPEKSLNGKLNPDLDKFRPKGLRGLAGGNMLGGKNMDIWKMLHSSYEESEPTFIPTP